MGWQSQSIYPLKPNPTLQVIVKTSANALDKPSENSRHRGDTYTPPRWRFPFTAVKLSRHRGESFLSKAGYTLSKSIKRDVVIMYFIEHKIYNIDLINMFFEREGYKLFSIN